ncbi:MAG: dihydropteroate synthase [Betaproteobacteria bacterium TMED82]|nr:MAG: dihydropteroate synthase [Betaproteobacteria bacterium TMED82]
MEKVLFLTGRLAEASLRRVLSGLSPNSFEWEIMEIGLQVAALMTTDMIGRRIKKEHVGFDRIIVPGRCRGDLEKLSKELGVPVVKGPEELKDLPKFFNAKPMVSDLSKFDILIFAEIVDATQLSVEDILKKAEKFRSFGANVIDLGCLPATEFDHLEDAVMALKEEKFLVSVDSLNSKELIRGGLAGADYLLSLTPQNLWVANEVDSVPILIPSDPENEESLFKSVELLMRQGRKFFADSILDPIPFGCLKSLCRFQRLRDMFPSIDIMVGVGNITELMDTDTNGVNSLLVGLCTELNVSAVLTTQVGDHARRAIKEIDIARKVMFASRTQQTLPKNLNSELLTIHEKKPFLDSEKEIKTIAKSVKDPNFRIQINEKGLYVYNRDGLRFATDPFSFYENLGLENDSSHAFYMGVELARAEVAWRLGKRYSQDKGLEWGVAADTREENYLTHSMPKIKRKIRNLKKR